MNHRRTLFSIVLLYFSSQFSPIQAQVNPSRQDSSRTVARQVATDIITYGERDGSSYRISWSTLLPHAGVQRGSITFCNRNTDTQVDSLDALQVILATEGNRQTSYSDESFLDFGIDGKVTERGDTYTSSKNDGGLSRSFSPNARYMDVLRYVAEYIIPEYK
ncbi:hypothetical protein HY491_02635 [Candidatus Woesearchaeota archaeon]|nr:hypothetical protein [Candidatus Woesearchaeota archaeon]